MLNRLLAACLLAGLLAGLAVAALQHFVTTPLILAAEIYEAPGAAAPAAPLPPVIQHPGGHTHSAEAGAPEWKPADGLQRTAFTSLATIAAATGFAMILLAAMLLSGDKISPRMAFGWAVCGFAATGLAPALGLAPLLPGSAAGPLEARQVWWLATALATAGGLWLLLRHKNPLLWIAGAALVLAPHMLGAPHEAAFESRAPAELAARFVAASLAVQAALWMLSGLAAGAAWVWLDGRKTA